MRRRKCAERKRHINPLLTLKKLFLLSVMKIDVNAMIALTQRVDEAEENEKGAGFIAKQLLQRFAP